MIETILLVAVLVVGLLCGVLLVVLIKKAGKSGLNGQGFDEKTFRQEQEKIELLMKADNDMIIQILKQANTNLTDYIKQYLDSMTKVISETNSVQISRLKDVQNQVQNVFKDNETRLDRIHQTLQQNITKLQESNEKKLEEMRMTVDEKLQSTLEKRISTSFTQVSERLEQVYKGLGEMRTLAGDVGDLKKVLSNVKTRGTWGEVQLGNLLEQMLSKEQFMEQVMLDKNSTERVDFVVVLPGKDEKNVFLPIDAKYPIESYQRLVEESEKANAVAVEQNAKELEKTIKQYAKDISTKYIKVPTTTDFAIMYLPIEGLFAEVVKNTQLVQMLQRDFRIMVCGPTTLAALLNSLQMGFRTLAIEKRSSEVWTILATFKNEFAKFYDLLLKTQKKLNEASNTIEDATKKTRTIERKLRSVDSLEPQEQNTSNIGYDEDN